MLSLRKSRGCARSRGALLAKGDKENKSFELHNKRINKSSGIRRNPCSRRKYETRNIISMCHLYSTHKLMHWKLITSEWLMGTED